MPVRLIPRQGASPTTKALIATCMATTPMLARAYAERRWGSHASQQMFTRDGVGALTSASPASALGAADDTLFTKVRELSIVGRLTALREVEFDLRLLRSTTVARGYWVGQSKAIPVSLPAFAGSTLPRRKIGVIILETMEAMQSSNPLTEQRIEDDVVTALAGAEDEAFLDPLNLGIADEVPASVLYGVAPITSAGDPASDIAAIIGAFTGDLTQAVWIADPLTATQIALARDAGGSFAFADAGPAGGSILGLPLLTSRYARRDSSGGLLALIDASGVAYANEGVQLFRSTSATIEADDTPTGATDTPVAASANRVSLFQTDTVAIKGLIYANWERQRDCVAFVSGIDYPTAVGS